MGWGGGGWWRKWAKNTEKSPGYTQGHSTKDKITIHTDKILRRCCRLKRIHDKWEKQSDGVCFGTTANAKQCDILTTTLSRPEFRYWRVYFFLQFSIKFNSALTTLSLLSFLASPQDLSSYTSPHSNGEKDKSGNAGTPKVKADPMSVVKQKTRIAILALPAQHCWTPDSDWSEGVV